MFGPAVQLMLILQLHSEADFAQAPTGISAIPSQTGTPLPTARNFLKNGSTMPAMCGRGENHNLKRGMMPVLPDRGLSRCVMGLLDGGVTQGRA